MEIIREEGGTRKDFRPEKRARCRRFTRKRCICISGRRDVRVFVHTYARWLCLYACRIEAACHVRGISMLVTRVV